MFSSVSNNPGEWIKKLLLLTALIRLPAAGFAQGGASSGTTGDCTWILSGNVGDYTLTIDGDGATGDYSPDSAAPWYAYQGNIKTLILKPGVTRIGDYAFAWCSALTSVTLPNGVTGIGEGAFARCGSLSDVTLPDSVTDIEDLAFMGCSGLKVVTVKRANPISLPGGVFRDVPLTEVALSIPIGTKALYEAAEGWKKFGTVVEPLASGAIGECAWTLSGDTGSYTLTLSGNGALGIYAPHSDAPWYAYRDSIKNLILRHGITGIGTGVFADCSSLTDVSVEWNRPRTLADDAFLGVPLADVTLRVPAGTKALYEAAGGWKEFGTINDSTQTAASDSIGNCAWTLTGTAGNYTLTVSGNGTLALSAGTSGLPPWASYLLSIKTVILEQGVTGIGEAVFSGCSSLTSVALPAGMTGIGAYAFRGCGGLRNLTVAGTTPPSLANDAFDGVSLADVTLIVSSGTKALYAADKRWKAFGTIVERIASGTAGNCMWTLTAASAGGYTLTVSGSGTVGDYDDGAAPWYAYRDSIRTLILKPGITRIGEYAFEGYDSLSAVTFPEGLTGIDGYAFYGCGLRTVTIPAGVTGIGDFAFGDCHSLTAFTVTDGSVSFVSVNGVLFNSNQTTLVKYPEGKNGAYYRIPTDVKSIGPDAFGRCHSLISVTIPGSVSDIGGYAFYECRRLSAVTLPEDVTEVGEKAFYGCVALRDVTVKWPEPLSLSDNVFEGVPLADVTLHVPAGTKALYVAAEGWKAFGTVTEPIVAAGITGNCVWTLTGAADLYTLTVSGNGAMGDYDNNRNRTPWYAYREGIRSVILEPGVTCVGTYAFEACSGLNAVTIPSGVTGIKDWAFAGCINLSAVALPSGVTDIGSNAFRACFGLTSVTLPVGVKSIGKAAFERCSGLSAVVLPEGVTDIEEETFIWCSSLSAVTLPASVTGIGNRAFAFCSRLNAVTLPGSVKSIGERAFYGCSRLSAIAVPSGVTGIGEGAFARCGSLTSITVATGNASFVSVDGVLFNNDQTVQIQYPAGKNGAYVIPSGVTDIGVGAFEACSGLSAVTLPAGVRRIGREAFGGCSALKDVIVEWENPLPLSGGEFEGVPLTEITLHVPLGRKALYKAAAGWNSFGTVAESPASGTTGNCMWTLTETDGHYTLTISGSGAMEDYIAYNVMPWYPYRSSIGTLVLEQGVTGIGVWAFAGCSRLSAVVLPEGVTNVGNYAFDGCRGLNAVSFPESMTGIGDYAFNGCSNLSAVTLPVGATGIGKGAFAGCSRLNAIILPAGMTAIEEGAFNGCGSLISVTVERENPLFVSGYVFQGVPLAGATLHVPIGRQTFYRAAAVWKDFGTIIDDVTVRPATASLSLVPQSLDFAADGAALQLTVKARVSWTAVSSTEWVILDDRNSDGVINVADLSADNLLTVRATPHTGTAPRNAGITFTGGDGLTQTVFVTQAAPVLPASVSLNKTELTLSVSRTEELVAVVLPAEADDRRVTWLSDNPQVAVVSSDGLVKAVAAGKAVITARTVAGDLTARCTVRVEEQRLIAEPDVPSNSQGSIEVSLKVPVDDSFSITFTLTLPAGFNLSRATSLTEALKSRYRLSFEPDGNDGWLFEITPVSTLSADDITYQRVANIVYTLDEDVAIGNHTVRIKGMELKLPGSDTTIRRDEISIPVMVPPGATGSADVVGPSLKVWYHGGLLYVDTPQREGITIYSMVGRMLYRVRKTEGAAVFNLHRLPHGVLMVRGDSGWTRKIVR